LFRPVRIDVERFVTVGEVPGTAIVQYATELPSSHAVLKVANGLTVVELKYLHLEFPSRHSRVDVLASTDEPSTGKDQVRDEGEGVVGSCESRLVIDSEDGDLSTGHHIAELLKAIPGNLSPGLRLIPEDDNVCEINSLAGQAIANPSLLVGATVGSLHLGRRDEFRSECSRFTTVA
jgi:hypothetical protein